MVKSVMLVDDAEADQVFNEYIIQKIDKNLKIFKSYDGSEALNFISQNHNDKDEKNYIPPDVIFLDINMPLMDGFEFLEKFEDFRKTHDEYKSQVIVMLTSSDQQSDIERTKEYESVKGFLVKPLSPEKFQDVVSNLNTQH